ncbi:MAG: (2Fe-2S)-binding protein [Pigmentiphaga sp.]|uniref:(2Fe-2S)-binding protein n=1 Tax=Pigmentiphaga sp. TaxID=1977564 RepID=UPI0029A392AD|nr:(2Fe-2S)-binding protein [Pigmentiphaga sp.]MDX3905343.1 (2Fe-2S)-binding protein [Pigmentiphaga sp.]
MIEFTLNGKQVSADVAGDKPLLWVLRENFQLTGTKFGCGMAQCGACTVHLNGQPTRSCVLPAEAVKGAAVTTVEGLMETDAGKALRKAWIAHQVPQCGYCQSGQLMTAAGILKEADGPLSREQVLDGMAGNLCRCGTYNQIAEAVVSVQKSAT